MGNGETPITQIYMPPRTAILRLVEAGVVRGLDAARLDALRAECWGGDEEQMGEAGGLRLPAPVFQVPRQRVGGGVFLDRGPLLVGEGGGGGRGGGEVARRCPF